MIIPLAQVHFLMDYEGKISSDFFSQQILQSNSENNIYLMIHSLQSIFIYIILFGSSNNYMKWVLLFILLEINELSI